MPGYMHKKLDPLLATVRRPDSAFKAVRRLSTHLSAAASASAPMARDRDWEGAGRGPCSASRLASPAASLSTDSPRLPHLASFGAAPASACSSGVSSPSGSFVGLRCASAAVSYVSSPLKPPQGGGANGAAAAHLVSAWPSGHGPAHGLGWVGGDGTAAVAFGSGQMHVLRSAAAMPFSARSAHYQ
jgi:hypothetical protein